MEPDKSLDELLYNIIAALLRDAQASFGVVFNTRALRLTLKRVECRLRFEGVGFLTKTLPRLGKHLDQVLSGNVKMDPTKFGFKTIPGSQLPRFLGELFQLVVSKDGYLLPDADAKCVACLRQILYSFYKYELGYSVETEREVITAFKDAEKELEYVSTNLAAMHDTVDNYCRGKRRVLDEVVIRAQSADTSNPVPNLPSVIREARISLHRLFSHFDPHDIIPRHGPGVVATKQKLWEKFHWTNICSRITDQYPLDEFFCSSFGHVCDEYRSFSKIGNSDLPAKVLLVPKDSRGPRLISCEPVDFQWVQQGLGRAIVQLVEHHESTMTNVFFTDQEPNQRAARYGSSNGRYATLDLKEASDRVSLELVRLLFPSHVFTCLEACRSLATELPDGEVLRLRKFAPMGSALCFPIMALTIWSLLSAAAPNAYTRERILVYGDDVIVPTAFAVSAMTLLESFGLKINRDKSCIQGPFKESCGMDAFKGVPVTPVRFRTVWTNTPSPDAYSSWISYANLFWDRGYFHTYDEIVMRLERIYGPIPDESMHLACPSLRKSHTNNSRTFRKRWNKSLQKTQYHVRVLHSATVTHISNGWEMLLRYFTEAGRAQSNRYRDKKHKCTPSDFESAEAFTVGQYTKRNTSVLVRRWR